MGYGYAYDSPGRQCSGGPTPGAVALSAAARARFPLLTDAGIYACRKVVGGSSLSTHAEGRGVDLGTPTAAAVDQGHQCAAWLVDQADALGVQEVIWQRRRWDSRVRVWAPYGGGRKDPHTSHVHVALCRAAASGLSPAQLGAISTAAAAGAGAAGDGVEHGAALLDGRLWVRVMLVLVALVLLVSAVVLAVRDLRGRRA